MKLSNPTTRRQFIKASTATAAACAFPTIIPSTVLGSNAPSNRVNIGLIGLGLMMGGHQRTMTNREDVQVMAVCDVDTRKREDRKSGG